MSNKSAIIGFGNAITDISCEVNDNFLIENKFIKGSMTLIDNDIDQQLSQLNYIKIDCGGSVANSISALSQFGVGSSFIGKVANDEFGTKFIEKIESQNICFLNKNYANNKSAKSFIMVSQDGQRTMATYLGCASDIDENDIKKEYFINNKILYLEGYLWDKDSTIAAIKKSIKLAKNYNVKVAFSLSDSFCVLRHKNEFLDIIKNDIDILFANESEIKELLNVNNIYDKNFYSDIFNKNPNIILAITKSENGCEVITGDREISCPANGVDRVIDTTGAGDCFAAGFLFGIINNLDLKKTCQFANFVASRIIRKFGARFDDVDLIEINNYKNKIINDLI